MYLHTSKTEYLDKIVQNMAQHQSLTQFIRNQDYRHSILIQIIHNVEFLFSITYNYIQHAL